MGSGFIFKRFLITCLLCLSTLQAGQPSNKTKAAVSPYLLPYDHSVKPILDHIFTSSRVILNLKSLEDAGFEAAKPGKHTKLIVTKHPAIKGYIFKLYLDAQRPHQNKPEHYFWIQRIQGAEKIRHEISRMGVEDHFTVPKKWIYALPDQKIPIGYNQKHYILIEEDMNILSKQENKKLWASDFVTPLLLQQFYEILTVVGLEDSAQTSNAPFTKDGKIAFVDTEIFGCKKVTYKAMDKSLSKKNRIIWKNLTR